VLDFTAAPVEDQGEATGLGATGLTVGANASQASRSLLELLSA